MRCQLDWYDFKQRDYCSCTKTAPEGREVTIRGETVRVCLEHVDEVRRVKNAGMEQQLRWRPDAPVQQKLRGA